MDKEEEEKKSKIFNSINMNKKEKKNILELKKLDLMHLH